MRKFFLSLLLAGAVIAASTVIGHAKNVFPMPTFFVVTLLFLTAVTGLSFALLYKSSNPFAFLRWYLLSTTFRLLGYGAYNLVVIFKDRSGATANVLFFMLTYLVFTVLEIAFLYVRFSRPAKP